MKTWTAPNRHGCLKEGDTPSWFFFLPLGGNDPADPSKPGWGGQYARSEDGWYRDLPARAHDADVGVTPGVPRAIDHAAVADQDVVLLCPGERNGKKSQQDGAEQTHREPRSSANGTPSARSHG